MRQPSAQQINEPTKDIPCGKAAQKPPEHKPKKKLPPRPTVRFPFSPILLGVLAGFILRLITEAIELFFVGS